MVLPPAEQGAECGINDRNLFFLVESYNKELLFVWIAWELFDCAHAD